MKKLFTLMLGAVMATTLLFTGCGKKNINMEVNTSSQSVEANAMMQRGSDAGVIENNVYTSKLLGLKYTATEGMILANAELLDKMNQEYKDRLHGTSIDMYCGMDGENKSSMRIELMKPENPHATYDQIMSTVSKSDDLAEKKYSTEKCKICDMEFTKISYTEAPNSKRFVKKIDKYIVIINIVAADNESIDKLLSGFSKVAED